MSPTQVHLVMIAAGIGAYAAFAAPWLHGARPRAARHALGATAAALCAIAPFLAWRAGAGSGSDAHLERAVAIAILGLGALACGLTLAGRRAPTEADPLDGADRLVAADPEGASEDALRLASPPAPPAPPPSASLSPPAPEPAPEPASEAETGPESPPAKARETDPATFDLADTELRFRALRARAHALDLPEDDAWRTAAVLPRDAAPDGPVASRRAAGHDGPAPADVGRDDDPERAATDADADSGADVADAEVVAETALTALPDDVAPVGGTPTQARATEPDEPPASEPSEPLGARDEVASEDEPGPGALGFDATGALEPDPALRDPLGLELERERRRAARAEARATEAERARETLRALLEREREALRTQRAATARAVRIAREAIAALAARERSDRT